LARPAAVARRGALDPERLGFDLAVLLEMTWLWPRLMPALARSLASGCGIPYEAYQPEFAGHVDRLRRPLNERYLVGDWLASVEGLTGRLAPATPWSWPRRSGPAPGSSATSWTTARWRSPAAGPPSGGWATFASSAATPPASAWRGGVLVMVVPYDSPAGVTVYAAWAGTAAPGRP
jgi:hypothetical protein